MIEGPLPVNLPIANSSFTELLRALDTGPDWTVPESLEEMWMESTWSACSRAFW